MKTKRITKKLLAAQATFKANVIEAITAMGAVPNAGKGYEYLIATGLGPLGIEVHDSGIYCRFDDENLAYLATRGFCRDDVESCRSSGKWNFLFSDDVTTLTCKSAVCDFTFYLEWAVAYKPSDTLRKAAVNIAASRRPILTTL